MFNIAVMVSGSGSNLQTLIDKVKEGYIEGQISLVVSDQEKAYALERGKDNHIAATYIRHDKEKLLRALEDHKIDLIVLAGYLSILPKEIIEKYPERIINIHPSLIPKYSGKGFYGMHVHRAVIEAGEKESGATVHFVDQGIDTGSIIIQEKLDLEPGETAESLQKKVLEVEHRILPKAVKLVIQSILEEKNESYTERI